jgi:hypothetical protein
MANSQRTTYNSTENRNALSIHHDGVVAEVLGYILYELQQIDRFLVLLRLFDIVVRFALGIHINIAVGVHVVGFGISVGVGVGIAAVAAQLSRVIGVLHFDVALGFD